MNLTSVYARPDRHELLYALLSERDEAANISHRAMPSFEDHCRFVESMPYEGWYFIGDAFGACYLSHQNEIGVFVFKQHRGKGYGPQAVKALMELHGKRRYLANVSPRNEASAAMFAALGFKMVQHTYEVQ